MEKTCALCGTDIKGGIFLAITGAPRVCHSCYEKYMGLVKNEVLLDEVLTPATEPEVARELLDKYGTPSVQATYVPEASSDSNNPQNSVTKQDSSIQPDPIVQQNLLLNQLKQGVSLADIDRDLKQIHARLGWLTFIGILLIIGLIMGGIVSCVGCTAFL